MSEEAWNGIIIDKRDPHYPDLDLRSIDQH